MDTDCAEALPFEDRTEAGLVLGRRLFGIHWPAPAIVLGLPRGGVPVAREVARLLHAPLDVIVVRKVPHPNKPEFSLGAIGADGIVVRNPRADPAVSAQQFAALAAAQRVEVEQREIRFRPGRPPLSLAGRTAILVDDGVATGATMRAALMAARAMNAAYVVVAVPVGAREALKELSDLADEVVCLYRPVPFRAVGFHYAKFRQVRDSDVRTLLDLPVPQSSFRQTDSQQQSA